MDKKPIQVLFFEDNPGDIRLIQEFLRIDGKDQCALSIAERLETGLMHLTQAKPDVILLDLGLPDSQGLETFKKVYAQAAGVPIVVLTGLDDAEKAVEAVKAGAQDYLVKGEVDGILLVRSLRYAIERKQVEEALRESERGLKEAQTLGLLGSWRLDIESQAITWSEQVYQIYERDPVLGPPTLEQVLAYYSLEQAHILVEYSTRAINEGKSFEFDQEVNLPTGKNLSLSTKIQPIQDANGRVIGLFGTIQDITERKQAEENLRENEQRLSSIYNTVGDVIFHLTVEPDEQYRFGSVNPAFLKVTGLSSGQVVGRKVSEVIPESSLSMVLGKYRQAIKEKTVVRWEETSDYPTGRLIGEVSVGPVFDEAGNCTHLVGSVHDITERKRAEEELIKSEAKFRAIFDNASTGMFIVDLKAQKFFMCNSICAKMLGYAKEEFLNLDIADIHPGEDMPFINEQILKFSRGEEGVRSDIKFKRKNGSIFAADLSPALLTIADKEYLLISFIDITERKQAVDKLEEERILLRTLIDNLPDLIYVMDVQGRKLVSNIADWQASGGKRMEDVIGKTDLDIYPPELAKDYWALDKAVIDTGVSIINREEPGLDSRGNPVWILSSKVPLRDGQGKVIGLVGIGHDITDRKQREEEIRSRTEELATLYQLSRLLADAGDLESAIELITRHAVESVHITFACLALLEDSELVTRAVHPVRVLDHDFIIGGRHPLTALPVCQHILDKNEPVILQAGSPEVGSLERLTLQLDFARSVCLVPLRVGSASGGSDQAVGLLILGEARQEQRESFTPEKIRLARSIGDQAAVAIRRMLLREQAGRRLQQLASLSEIDRTIASSFDLRLNLQMILKYACEQLEVDAADILVLNDRLQILEFTAGRGFLSPANEATRQRMSEGQAGRAFRERNIVQIPDVASSGAVFAQPELIKAEHVAAYFAVPLITKRQVKGVLEIYHRTPLNPNAEWLDFLKTLAGQAAIAIDDANLFSNLQRSNTELALAYDATIEGWSHALELRDKETEGHTLRVADMTVKLARSLGLGENELVQVRWGVLLHDIGKMGVADSILLKPGPLTAEEWVVMKKHPTFAYEMLSPIRYLRLALDIPYCHHEKWDGSGYPRGLKGEQIPLVARIFAVVDVWDALTSDRPYRLAWSEEKARQLIKSGAGTHFDPQVVKEFLSEYG